MKRYAIPIVIVLAVLALVLVSFGQQERPRRGPFMGREERVKAIEAIEAQLAKLKQEPDMPRPEGGFQNMSEEERTKFREQMRKVFQERQKVFQVIMAQLAGLQRPRREPVPEGTQYMIISTADLKPIQEMAEKEKAKETVQLLARMASRGSGRFFGGRRPGGQRGGQQ